MTPDEIRQRGQLIMATSKSVVAMQCELMIMLCECLIAKGIAPDQYMIDIRDFHVKFGLPYDGPARLMTREMADFRIKFLEEELNEYREAVRTNDLEKQFDGLIDLVYIALGTAYLQGFPFQRGWQRVQDANMQKMRATNKRQSSRQSTLDIVKPEGWKSPVLSDLIAPPL